MRRLEGWLDELERNMHCGRSAHRGHREVGSLELAEARARGFGAHEVPRGALGHWVEISDGTISRYQAVVPTTWNASPRDAQGRPGPTSRRSSARRSRTPKRPLELLRTVHSFDPCLACAVHVPSRRRERLDGDRPSLTRTDGSPPVYVWELPVRIVHWTIVLALIVLSVTGYYIHHPFLAGGGAPGHPGFTMGTIRFVHEATGFVFTAAVLFRIYWAFVGNRYAHWRGAAADHRARSGATCAT